MGAGGGFSSALSQGAAPISCLLLRYQLAVTRRKEEEPSSTSNYNQNEPWTPTVAFADFINNETITNEVSWGPLGWSCGTQPLSCPSGLSWERSSPGE